MLWEKLGLVSVPPGGREWAASHAYIPTPRLLTPGKIRIYAAFQDRSGIGRIGFVDVAAGDPCRVLAVSAFPVLDVGEPGTFDDNGVAPVCLVEDDNRVLLYYLGFQLGVKVRYTMFIGVAISTHDGPFLRYSRVPILDRSNDELFVRSAAHVLHEGSLWKMWYVAGDRWIETNGKLVPVYNIRYLESPDGIHWGKSGRVAIDLESDEFGLGRPFILRESGTYQMWFSSRKRSRGYRICYAESSDGLEWKRKDGEVGIDISASGWDSEMICCCSVLKTQYGTYMFYNGNNYGRDGFGIARLLNEN